MFLRKAFNIPPFSARQNYPKISKIAVIMWLSSVTQGQESVTALGLYSRPQSRFPHHETPVRLIRAKLSRGV